MHQIAHNFFSAHEITRSDRDLAETSIAQSLNTAKL